MRDDIKPFQTSMQVRLDATSGEYLSALHEALAPQAKPPEAIPWGRASAVNSPPRFTSRNLA